MRRDTRIVQKDFYNGLKDLGYVCFETRAKGSEWRRGKFHLIVRLRSTGRVVISLHEDMRINFPPFHKVKRRTKELENEFDSIMKAYCKQRHGTGSNPPQNI